MASLICGFLFLIKPIENTQFELYQGGKEGFKITPNIGKKTSTLTIPAKRINQEIAEKIRFDETKSIGIKGIRLDFEDNHVVFKGSFLVYKNPIGLTLGLTPRYQSKKIYLVIDSARLGLIKLSPGSITSIAKNIITGFGTGNMIGYSDSTNEFVIDLNSGTKNADIRDIKFRKDNVEVEISNNIKLFY